MSPNAEMSIQNSRYREKKRAEKLYVLLLNYRLSDMSCDYLACKIRELRGENTILISAYELEGNMVTNLKHKKNYIVVDSIRS
jgi:hypothetical protein